MSDAVFKKIKVPTINYEHRYLLYVKYDDRFFIRLDDITTVIDALGGKVNKKRLYDYKAYKPGEVMLFDLGFLGAEKSEHSPLIPFIDVKRIGALCLRACCDRPWLVGYTICTGLENQDFEQDVQPVKGFYIN